MTSICKYKQAKLVIYFCCYC